MRTQAYLPYLVPTIPRQAHPMPIPSPAPSSPPALYTTHPTHTPIPVRKISICLFQPPQINHPAESVPLEHFYLGCVRVWNDRPVPVPGRNLETRMRGNGWVGLDLMCVRLWRGCGDGEVCVWYGCVVVCLVMRETGVRSCY